MEQSPQKGTTLRGACNRAKNDLINLKERIIGSQ